MSLAHWAARVPDEPAIISSKGRRTLGELNARANQLARGLRRMGLHPGDAVAISATNAPEWAEVIQACIRSGLRYTPINWHLTPAEISYILEDCAARVFVGDTTFADKMAEAARLADVETRLALGGPIDGFGTYETALDDDERDIGDPVIGNRMLYTSGTTGRPKGVLRPPLYSTGLEALSTAPGYAAGEGQLNLCTGPLHHGGPLGFSLNLPLSQGVGVVLMDRWDAAEALTLIEAHGITHTHMVPTMFHRLLRLPDEVRSRADVSSLRYVVHGAAPCSVETKRAMLDWFGPIIWEYYAATEGAGASCSPQQWLERPGTVGLPPAPGHVRIVDGNGQDCGTGEVGTICLRKVPGAEFEYHGDPEKTARSDRGDGYFTVGDLGLLDDDGYLFVTDRDAELIVRGGVNVYPAEIEAALGAHPGVADAAAIGVPHPDWGEAVVALIVPEQGFDADELVTSLEGHCRERLAGFKVPSSFEAVDSLPRQDNGKLYRHRLRDERRRATSEAAPR